MFNRFVTISFASDQFFSSSAFYSDVVATPEKRQCMAPWALLLRSSIFFCFLFFERTFSFCQWYQNAFWYHWHSGSLTLQRFAVSWGRHSCRQYQAPSGRRRHWLFRNKCAYQMQPHFPFVILNCSNAQNNIHDMITSNSRDTSMSVGNNMRCHWA